MKAGDTVTLTGTYGGFTYDGEEVVVVRVLHGEPTWIMVRFADGGMTQVLAEDCHPKDDSAS